MKGTVISDTVVKEVFCSVVYLPCDTPSDDKEDYDIWTFRSNKPPNIRSLTQLINSFPFFSFNCSDIF